jgi:hypothetical protein
MAGDMVPRADQYEVAAPGANANILATSITPIMSGYFQIAIALTTGSVVNMMETRSGTTYTHGLNNSVAVDAGDIFTFTVPVSSSSAYNFQVETDGVIRVLRVWEVYDPVTVNGQGFQA